MSIGPGSPLTARDATMLPDAGSTFTTVFARAASVAGTEAYSTPRVASWTTATFSTGSVATSESGVGAMVSATGADVPPTGGGLYTVIDTEPGAARSLAGMSATSVSPKTCVARSLPFHRTMELLVNPVPATSRLVG